MANHRSVEINADLVKERSKCSFDLEELTNLIDGGKKKTKQRRQMEDYALNSGASIDPVPEECLSIQERYENAVRKSCVYSALVRESLVNITGLEDLGLSSPVLQRTSDAFFKEISPFLLHFGMFVPTIIGQCTPEQQAKWLPLAMDLQIIGTYAQTELGHGTFIRGLETTATYDPSTEEFVLSTPKLSSYKWWAGGLGKTASHCIVLAQLYTKGECHGPHAFIVQIRDKETHMPLPGIKVGEIGPKLGFNTADNGYLGFDNFRIPRDNLMMKNAQVTKDGTYVKVARHGKLTYGTMVFVRVMLVSDMAYYLAKAVTIAVRYSAVRRQSQPKPDQPEAQVLDYLTQQHKLFICISSSHAMRLTSTWLWKTFTAVLADMREGNTDTLPELHALSSCLKALSTSDTAALIEQCRFACGGHGYMYSSNLPALYSFAAATRTYEGDYTVLLLQTARFLVKSWEQMEEGKPLTPTLAYLIQSRDGNQAKWDDSPEGIIRAFHAIAAGRITSCVNSIRKHVRNGMDYEDAWQLTTVQLVGAAEAHCRAVICRVYRDETIKMTAECSPGVKTVLDQLSMLYLLYWSLEKTGDLLRFSSLSEKDIVSLQERYEALLLKIRPNAVSLVDAFDFRDEVLSSTLGSYDGRVYERLMEEALKTPLNKEPVNQSFHKYMKPMLQGKL
ncbi:probable peroxisomal acyl-coenzyme A oxidase 1 [Ostrinia furnacalis]|uniref:probable peroxisomal acyl-coenzyme A oxidase 1 n=1 Tax=Ostrinia furnacalis TaxID=93504 RepID=UPI00103C168E|nr:probable peroxisomal acyl-coenzyme A oxidase 1 [Ostrinia furnacalis]